MAVGNVKRLAGPFTGAGTKILPFGFKIFEPTDVFVALAEKENDPPKNLEYNADYSVEMNQDQEATPGGTVTLTNALNETQIGWDGHSLHADHSAHELHPLSAGNDKHGA